MFAKDIFYTKNLKRSFKHQRISTTRTVDSVQTECSMGDVRFASSTSSCNCCRSSVATVSFLLPPSICKLSQFILTTLPQIFFGKNFILTDTFLKFVITIRFFDFFRLCSGKVLQSCCKKQSSTGITMTIRQITMKIIDVKRMHGATWCQGFFSSCDKPRSSPTSNGIAF